MVKIKDGQRERGRGGKEGVKRKRQRERGKK